MNDIFKKIYMNINRKIDFLVINNDIKINLDNIYHQLHKSVLYDSRIQKMSDYLCKKYDLDVFSSILLDEKGENMLHNFHTDSWATYNLDSFYKGLKLNVFFSEVGLRTFNFLFTTTEGMDSIDYGSIMTPNREFLSAYIVGRKILGYTGIFYNKKNGYRIVFMFAFKNKTIIEIQYNIYVNFINDLRKMLGALDVFMIYFKEHKTIEDSLKLQQLIKEDELKNNYFS